MKSILTQLRQERASLHDRNKELLALMDVEADERSESISDEQISAEYEKNESSIADLDAEISRREQMASTVTNRDSRLSQSANLPMPAAPSGQQTGDVVRGFHTDGRSANWQIAAQRQYAGSLRHIRGNRGGLSECERAYRLGMWGLHIASLTLPHRYKFPKASRFVTEQGMIVHGEGAGDTTGANVTVPDEFSADMIDLKEFRGVVRRLFGREAMMRDTKTIPRRSSGLTAYAVGENAAGTESNMGLDDIMLVARKWMVLTRMSKELDEDNAVMFGDKLAGEVSYAFADKEDESGLNGDGTSTYHGIIGARTRLQDVDGSGTDSNGLVTGTGNLYSELALVDFEAVAGTLPQYADTPNTVWIVHRSFYFNVMKRLELAAGGVNSMEIQDGGGARRPRPMFLGYPVEFSQVMPSTEANSQVCALLGDFQLGAKFGDRRSETIEFDDTVTVGGQSVWERDQIAIKGTERYDIKVHEVGTSSVSGAIVGLQTASS